MIPTNRNVRRSYQHDVAPAVLANSIAFQLMDGHYICLNQSVNQAPKQGTVAMLTNETHRGDIPVLAQLALADEASAGLCRYRTIATCSIVIIPS